MNVLERFKPIVEQINRLYGELLAEAQIKPPPIRLLKFANESENEEAMPYLKEGTIRKRKDGRWEIRFMWDGKQISVTHRNQAECLKRFKEKLKQRDSGKKYISAAIEKAEQTLHEWLDYWIENYKVGKVSAGWLRKIKTVTKAHVKKNFQDLPLSKLNVFELEQCLKLVESSRIREDVSTIIKDSLSVAFKKGLLKTDVVAHFETYKHKRKETPVFTHEQQTEFLEYAKEKSKYYNYYLFYFNTGCRPHEISRIRLKHINRENSTLFIDGTKTITSKRSIPIFSPLIPFLDTLSEDVDYLFPMQYTAIVQDFEKMRNSLNLDKHYCLKSMRHTFATNLFEKELDIKTISAWLGHSNIQTTQKTYIHLLSEHEFRQAAKYDPDFDPNFDPKN